MQSMISNVLYLKTWFMSNMNSNFFWPSNFLLVGGWLVGGWCIWSVVGWLVVSGWLVDWYVDGEGGSLVSGFKETPLYVTS